MMIIEDMHVIPVADLVDHDLNRDCWCNPSIQQTCSECNGSGINCRACEDGFVEKNDPMKQAIVIHNAIDGRD